MPYPDLDGYLKKSLPSNNVSVAWLLQVQDEAALTRLNELLNNDVEIRGTRWEGSPFLDVTRQYQHLVAAMPGSPILQSIAEEMKTFLFQESFLSTISTATLTETALASFIQNRKIIISAGWAGHAVLMELIDTGKSIQVLVYNSGEGIENHGPAIAVGNKQKSLPVYALNINATLSSIQPQDLDNIITASTGKPPYTPFNWRYYLPQSFKLRKQVLAYKRFNHFFTNVFTKKGNSDSPQQYYAELKSFFSEMKNRKQAEWLPLPSVKKIDLSGLDLKMTPHRSGGCSIKVWFSAFQRFRSALSQLPLKKRKRYYYGGYAVESTKAEYALARLKAKCMVAFLAIKKQRATNTLSTLDYALDNCKILQNLLDAVLKFKEMFPKQADNLVEEENLLNDLNHWLVTEVLLPIKQQTVKPVIQREGPLTYKAKELVSIPRSGKRASALAEHLPLSEQSIQLKEIERFCFESLADYHKFAEYLSKREHKSTLLLDYAIRQYARLSGYAAPSDVNSLEKTAEWVSCQFQIIQQLQTLHPHNTTSVESSLIMEKIYLSVLETLKKWCDKSQWDVSKFFNLDSLNLENYAGLLGTPELRELARNNAAVRADKIDYYYDKTRFSPTEAKLWPLYFFKSLGVDLLALFDAYCAEKKLEVKFYQRDIFDTTWGVDEKNHAKSEFILNKIAKNSAGLLKLCQDKKITIADMTAMLRLLNVFTRGSFRESGYSESSQCIDFYYKADRRDLVEFQTPAPGFPLTAPRTLDAFRNKYFYKNHSEPAHRALLKTIAGSTEADMDYESRDLHHTAAFYGFTEREFALFKQLKHAYRSPTLRWSEGLQIMEHLLPLIDNLSPNFMRMALSVIGSDYTDYEATTPEVTRSRQQALLSLLEKSERHLSEPETHPAYFTYAALLQLFLIHGAQPIDQKFCEAQLKTYERRIAEVFQNPSQTSAEVIESASVYQLLDIYRRLVIQGDETNFSEDYRFFIKYLPKSILAKQQATDYAYAHPDLNRILTALQQYWMKKWNEPAALETMLTMIEEEKNPLSKHADEIILGVLQGESVRFNPWENFSQTSGPVNRKLPQALLDSRQGAYFKKQGITSLPANKDYYIFEKKPFQFEIDIRSDNYQAWVLHDAGEQYTTVIKSEQEICLSKTYWNDARYLCFVNTKSTRCLVMDAQTLEIVYRADIASSPTPLSLHVSTAVKVQSQEPCMPLALYDEDKKHGWLSFADPNYVEVVSKRNPETQRLEVKQFNCLQTGIQIAYQAGHWVCLQQPGLFCQSVPLKFKTSGLTGYLPLVGQDGVLKKVLVPRTPVTRHAERFQQQLAVVDGYHKMELSTFNYEDGHLYGHTIQDKLHLFYLYSIYGTDSEQSAALQDIFTGGSLDLGDPTIQYFLFLIFFGTPCPCDANKNPTQVLNPHLATLRLRLLLQIFAKSMYAHAEIDMTALLASTWVDDKTKALLEQRLSLPQLTIELSELASYYFNVERNLPHDKRLNDEEKQTLAHLIAKPYDNKKYPHSQLGPRTSGQPVVGDSALLKGNPDTEVFHHFSKRLPARPDTPVFESCAETSLTQDAFLKDMQDADALVSKQQKNIEFLLKDLNSDLSRIPDIFQQARILLIDTKAALRISENELYLKWRTLQQALGRTLSENRVGERRETPSFDKEECIRALFFGELQGILNDTNATQLAKEAARAMQEQLTQYLLKSILYKRLKKIEELCGQYRLPAETSAVQSNNQGIARKIASALLEKQLPESVADLRFLVIAEVLGFCLTDRQLWAVQDALTTGDCSKILEAEMGFGKSEVVLTAIALMKGDKLPVLVLPKQLMSLTENAIAKTAGYFGYTFNRIDYHREQNRNHQYFAFLLKTLETAIKARQIIVTDQASLEALKLSYIEKCNDPNSDDKSIQYLAKILQYFQNNVQVNQDEFHEQTLEKQFNYAEGDKVNVPVAIQNTLLAIYEMMRNAPTLALYLADPNLLVAQDHQLAFKKALKQCYLAHPLSPLAQLNLDKVQQNLFQKWLADELDDEVGTPDFIQNSYVLQTCKYFVNQVAVNALKKKAKENFGRNPLLGARMQSMVPIPYVFNEVPALGSEFANPIQLTALTIQLTLLNPIPWDIFRAYFVEKQSYYKLLRIKGKTSEEIEADPQLKILFQLGLGEALKETMRHTAFWENIFNQYRDNPTLKKLLLEEEILPKIQIHNQYLNDTHQDFIAQIHDYHGVSGTPPKVILPLKAQHNPTISKGVFFRVAQLLLRKDAPVVCADVEQLTLANYFEATKAAVAEKLDRFRVIFDLDNDFQGSTPYHVACHIHQWLNREEKEAALSDIKVVVFFEADKAYYVEVNDKTRTKHAIQDIKAIDKELNLRSMNEAFVYFDQSHCVGVNMQLASNVFALANTGPRVPVSLYQQMIYRLRELEGEQSVTTIIDKSKRGVIEATQVPAWGEQDCLQTANAAQANPQLIQLLYHAYQLMMKSERQGAPVAAEQTLQAALRNEILKQCYTAWNPRALLQKNKHLFYVDIDFMKLLEQGNAKKKPMSKKEFFDQLDKKYTGLLKEHYKPDQSKALMQSVRQQYETHSEDEIFRNEVTMDATAQAQQQAESRQYVQTEQMHQNQMNFHLKKENCYTKNYFSRLSLWLTLFRYSLSQWTGGGFFAVNQEFDRFKCDPQLLVTANHRHWMASAISSVKQSIAVVKNGFRKSWEVLLGMWFCSLAYFCMIWIPILPILTAIKLSAGLSAGLVAVVALLALVINLAREGFFASFFSATARGSYQEKDHNKHFTEVLVVQQHGKLYSIACTLEDVKYMMETVTQCSLKFMLYSVANKVVLKSNDPRLCDLLHAEPTEENLKSEDYRRLHGMRQQLRYLNGDLLSLAQDEKHWFFADPTDKKEMARVWSCYETEIKPYHAGQHAITKEQFDEQIASRKNCTPKAYQAQSKPNFITRCWINCKTCVMGATSWLLRKLFTLLVAIARPIYTLLSQVGAEIVLRTGPPPTRYDRTGDYIALNMPAVTPLFTMQEHTKRSTSAEAPREEVGMAPSMELI